MSEIITVAGVTHPAAGKKQGKIQDTQGRIWQVWADKISQFNAGQSYEILTSKTTQFNGATYVTIGEFRPLTPGVGAQQAAAFAPPPQQARAPFYPPTSPPPMPAPQQAAAAPISEHVRRMDIFICGAVNNMLANENINPLDINPDGMMQFITMMKEVWKKTLGPNAGQSPPAPAPAPAPAQAPSTAMVQSPTASVPFNDEIPF
jgi:hypothetical protein